MYKGNPSLRRNGIWQMKNFNVNYLKNIVAPALIFSFITGSLTGAIIVFYRLAASGVIHLSESIYSMLGQKLYLIPIALAVLALLAYATCYAYKKAPNLKGGGIPTSIGILRGLISFKWLRNIIGVWAISLSTFLVGVPLGNEGPCVQMGTAIGRGTVRTLAKKNAAWDRYVMTGGACAGFTAATNAPISGIMFAIEEAHQRISPMILMVAFISVMFSTLAIRILCPLFGLQPDLFPGLEEKVKTLELSELWIAAVIGLVIGLAASAFLKYYKLMAKLVNGKLANVRLEVKVMLIFVLTLGFGLISYSFISTGHGLIEDLMTGGIAWYILIVILIFRATMMLAANITGITGGMFLPIIVLSAIISSLLGRIMITLGIISSEYYSVIIVLGIAACISGMMKCPLTAIVFSLEALFCTENILPVIVSAALAYFVTEVFNAKSINETVIERRTKEINAGKTPVVIDTFVTVKASTFAIGKQIRDIFWPCNLFVLSIKHSEKAGAVVDTNGDKTIREGDILHVRYSCYDEEEAKRELLAIVGQQELEENIVRVV